MELETVRTEVADGVMVLTLDRPDRMNAFTEQMLRDLIAAFDAADADDDVRVVIVTGAGRAFCAGADLATGGETFDASARGGVEEHRDGGGLVALRIFECRKLVIGAINGAAVGVGVTMTLPMDVRLASQDARFGFVFARRGITPEAASSWFLPRVVGISRAMEWVGTGRVFDAQEALDGGLVRSVHPPGSCSPPPTSWRRRSCGTRRRCRSRSPVRCCGACSAPSTRWRPTASTRARSSSVAARPTCARASPRSSRSARPGSPTGSRRPARRVPRGARGLGRRGRRGGVAREPQETEAQPALDRAERDARVLGDLGRAQAAPVGERDRAALGRREPVHRGAQQRRDAAPVGRLQRGLAVLGGRRQLVLVALAHPRDPRGAPPGVDRPAAGEHAQEPAEVAALDVEPVRAAPDLEEHVVRQVLGEVAVAQDPQGDPEDLGGVSGVHRGERRLVGEAGPGGAQGERRDGGGLGGHESLMREQSGPLGTLTLRSLHNVP
jgi:enoyl-CoA hydratase/carnithine racemase